VLTLSASNGTFKIPPGDPDYKVDATFEVRKNVKLVGFASAHALARESVEYRLVFPDGKKETILSVPVTTGIGKLWYTPCGTH